MVPTQRQPKLLVIVGPTASGKSALAIKIAKKYKGEIIAADSRTVYRDMDIGTAKPTKKDQAEAVHWGIDLIDPGQRFTAHDFKCYAEAKIKEIQARGKMPILVGGTGLYIDSILFDYKLPADRSLLRRRYLELRSAKSLRKMIQKKSYPMPENDKNKRHLVRSLERRGVSSSKASEPLPNSYVVGLFPNDSELRRRINNRAEAIFNEMLKETQRLVRRYGRRAILRSAGLGYDTCLDVANGKVSQSLGLELFKTAHWQYARRQKTWFKRNKYIHRFDSSDEAYTVVEELLNK